MINSAYCLQFMRALSDIICFVVPEDMVKSWLLTWFVWPIADVWGYFFTKDGVADGVLEGFTKEESVCKMLFEECMICQGDDKVACKLIWAPPGTGKTVTLCNLMAEARVTNPGTEYTRVDWESYPKYSFGRDMYDWMQSQRQAKQKAEQQRQATQKAEQQRQAKQKAEQEDFTVLFMDHFDHAMGKTLKTRELALEFVQKMIDSAQSGEERFIMIICVNSLDNLVALRDMQCVGNNRDHMRMVGLGSQEKSCMMWKSREDAKRFAEFAFGQTTPASRGRLYWGQGTDTLETQIEKLTDLVINAGCVKYAVRFLRGEQPRNMHVFMQLATRSKHEWEGCIMRMCICDHV